MITVRTRIILSPHYLFFHYEYALAVLILLMSVTTLTCPGLKLVIPALQSAFRTQKDTTEGS
jgi:hypothetical protein